MTLTYSQWIRAMGWLRENGFPDLERHIQEGLSSKRARYGEPTLRTQITIHLPSEQDHRLVMKAVDQTRRR